MKLKLSLFKIALSVTALLLPFLSEGQSSFALSNLIPNAGLDAPVFDAFGNRLSGANYVAMLYGGPSSDNLQPAWDEVFFHTMAPVQFTYAPQGLPGYFMYSGYVQIGGVPGGATVWLQVRAWDARLGTSYEEVQALGIGGYSESNLFQKSGGDPGGGVPSLPEPLIGLQSFSLRAVIPEPSSTGLLLLGLPLLLWRKT
jgi:hypothetical protein